jgi:hypothetical protein
MTAMTAMTVSQVAPGSVPVVTLPLVTAIENTWSAIRDRHPEVPPVVVTLGSGTLGERGQQRLGHFAAGRWQVGDDDQHAELFIGGEGLQRGGVGVLTTLLHEAAHGLASTRNIVDTSRQGRYHNQRFRDLAVEVGLMVTADPKIGYAPSELAPGIAELYDAQLAELAGALVAFRHPEPRGGRDRNRSAGNGIAAVCSCPEPRRIRVRSLQQFEAGPIVCGICREPFTMPENDEG